MLLTSLKMLYASYLRLFITLLLSLLEINGEDFGLNSKSDDCLSLQSEHGDYEKISPSSKYLMFTGNFETEEGWTADESRTICDMMDQLEQAEVTNVYDLQSLERYISTQVWIGLNHRKTPGVFLQASGAPIKFQSFVEMEPNNLRMSERCVMLAPAQPLSESEGGFLVMVDARCDSVKARALCQYRRGSSCFLQSAEETTSSSMRKKDPEVASLGIGSRFFVSTIQRTWSAAAETCLAKGLQLITLDDDDINQDLTDQMKKRLDEQHFHPATQFWTAGTLQAKSNSADARLVFVSGDDSTLSVIDLIPHQWAKATSNTSEPFDQSGSGLETCLDMSFENSYLSSIGSYKPLWRISNCLLPKFFICERVPHGISEDTIHSVADRQLEEGGNINPDGLETFSGDEIKSCGNLDADPLNFEIDVTRPQTTEDILKFLIFNVENDLKSGIVPYEVKNEIKWKETVIDLLVQIAKKSVDTVYIDHGLLNVVKVVILMYFNALPANATKNQPLWTGIYVKHLQECLDIAKKLELIGTGFEIKYLTTLTGDILEDVEINVPEEHADKIKNLDAAVDILWYLFSFSMGLCYNLPQDKIGFASDFHVIFIADFMNDLRNIWTINVEKAESTHSRGLDYSLALGDFDFMQSFRNLRYLVTAAYIKSGVENLQLVRPLDMSLINSDLPIPLENAKTGNHLKTT